MSKYFLKPRQSLVHGAELFMRLLEDRQFVEEVADQKRESEIFTFQVVCRAINDAYPEHEEEIMSKLVEMLAFDAIIGHNDRHGFNWAVITPVKASQPPCFSPIFDTARALFWNNPERKVEQAITDNVMFNAYLRRSRPQIGWRGHDDGIGHFELIEALNNQHPQYRPSLEKLIIPDVIDDISSVVEEEFEPLMSAKRRKLIMKCLEERFKRFCQIVASEKAYA